MNSNVDYTNFSRDIESTVEQLEKNNNSDRLQASIGFITAVVSLVMGLLVIFTGALGDMFGFTKTTSNLTTIAGVVVEVVSALGFFLFKETSKKLNATSDRLHENWSILAAFRMAETLPDDAKSNTKTMIINKVLQTFPGDFLLNKLIFFL